MKQMTLLRDSFDLKSEIAKKMDSVISINDMPSIIIPNSFTQINIENLSNIGYMEQIREQITPIVRSAEKLGFGGNIFTAIYEGVLNAFQHGNKYDSGKKIILASDIKDEKLEFIIADECKELPKEFMRFILAHRERTDQTSNFIKWYQFSGNEQKNQNNGTGTSFMHAYMDTVRYYRCEDTKGLALYLQKTK